MVEVLYIIILNFRNYIVLVFCIELQVDFYSKKRNLQFEV